MAIGPAALGREAEPYAALSAFLISASTLGRARWSLAVALMTCRTACLLRHARAFFLLQKMPQLIGH